MDSIPSITTVSHVIQLAVAPVFLLSGIGAILDVLINRLGRIVDRYRVLEDSSAHAGAGERTPPTRPMGRCVSAAATRATSETPWRVATRTRR